MTKSLSVATFLLFSVTFFAACKNTSNADLQKVDASQNIEVVKNTMKYGQTEK